MPYSDEKGATTVAAFEEERGNRGSEKGQLTFQKRVTPVAPTLSYGPFYRLSSQRDAQIAAGAFDDFWRVYPKKVALRDAIRAFARAIERGPPDEIIRGAMRYAAERDGEDPRYTKNPATWLNKACWNDPPPRARPWRDPHVDGRFNGSFATQMHSDDDFDEVLTRIQRQRKRD